MYFEEYNFNLMLEQGMLREQDTQKIEPPKIPVGSLKRDLPVYGFLVSLGVLTVVSMALLDADWHKLVQRFPRLGSVFFDMAHFST